MDTAFVLFGLGIGAAVGLDVLLLRMVLQRRWLAVAVVTLPAIGTTILVSFWIAGTFLTDVAD
ncbi:MAG: hypothetical protein P8Q36_13125 [Alphaproteobacteria bacterium]|jgi:hypothetical protein|nr:hypothetical protein [Rhodospirillaceae bacterium]MBT6205625.1 hypothetical protein [Rhodospirillaceae bacterium]MBT6511830.1 hypothetical protein [Rhodospirillaceae bacterium]MBT7613753.1 hypothetical protein [Rhodospirillaceae bacterium]MDG2481793.1 hypothetical protein [Alphaproteobacteria bacterium]